MFSINIYAENAMKNININNNSQVMVRKSSHMLNLRLIQKCYSFKRHNCISICKLTSININFVNVYIIDRSTETDNNDIAVNTTCPCIYWHLYYCSTDMELPHTTMYMNSSYYLFKFEKNTYVSVSFNGFLV